MWVDADATGEAGWVYNGDGTWTATAVNNTGVTINSLVSVGDTVKVSIMLLERTAGNVKPRVMGTVGSVQYTVPGPYTEIITDTLNFTKCGIVGFSGFTGTVRIRAFKVL